MASIAFFGGLLVGMMATYLSVYYSKIEPLRQERDEYRRSMAMWRKSCEGAVDNAERAIVVAEGALELSAFWRTVNKPATPTKEQEGAR